MTQRVGMKVWAEGKVEELFSLVTVQIFPCNIGRVFRYEKTFTIPRYISEPQDRHTMGEKPLQEMQVLYMPL